MILTLALTLLPLGRDERLGSFAASPCQLASLPASQLTPLAVWPTGQRIN